MTPEPDAADPPLPALIDLLWHGAREPRRGPRPALSLAKITDAAMAIADADGLAAVSMARVAESLGFTTMSLYRYVASKDELLALMSDAGTGAPPAVLREPGEGWRTGLERWAVVQYDMLLARPWVAELALYTLPVGPGRLPWLESGLAQLEETRLPADLRFTVVGLLSQHVLGAVRLEIDLRAMRGVPDDPAAVADAPVNPFATFEVVLSRLVDPVTYPALHRTVSALVAPDTPHPRPFDDDQRDEALFGIGVVLDGVERLVERYEA